MASNQLENKQNRQHCCVHGCTSDGQKNKGVHFHNITLARKKEWLQKIRRDKGEMFKVCWSVLVI